MAVCTTKADGTKEWRLDGEQALLHREGGPAVEYADGSMEWWVRGERHREDGPATEFAHGDKHWYHRGNFHREDGPAIEYASGTNFWYLHGKLHCSDGPAIEAFNGYKYWYFEGHALTEEQHARIRSRIERAEKARQHRIKWFILDPLLPRLCSPNSAAFLKRFHADWDAASSE